MLQETFINLISNYTKDEDLIYKLWIEIETNYSGKMRHYHNLKHLENLLQELKNVKDKIQNWNVILFTLFYHDSIYNALKTNNEEKSAQLAEKRMQKISVSIHEIELCKEQILATKLHQFSSNSDTNFFTDADLSILGHTWDNYLNYFKNVRKEYIFYPTFIYNNGRKKVIQHFLAMNPIFKTQYFFDKFETQAKENLLKEFEIIV